MNKQVIVSESEHKIVKYIKNLLNQEWCGKLEIKLFKGKVDHIKEERIRKLDEL